MQTRNLTLLCLASAIAIAAFWIAINHLDGMRGGTDDEPTKLYAALEFIAVSSTLLPLALSEFMGVISRSMSEANRNTYRERKTQWRDYWHRFVYIFLVIGASIAIFIAASSLNKSILQANEHAATTTASPMTSANLHD